MPATLRILAGAEATDCGVVRLGQDSGAADACVLAAFRAGHLFFVAYDRRGTDSHVARGLAGNPAGMLWVVDYDGNVSGGGGDGNPSIARALCLGAAASPTAGDRTLGELPIACASLGASLPVCP